MLIIAKTILLISFFIASAYDVRKLYIPNVLHIVIVAAGVLDILTGGISLFYGLWSFGTLVAVNIVLILTIDPFGGGDYKLIACTAFSIGIQKSVHGLTIAFLLVGVYVLFLKIRKRYNSSAKIPLAPFLAAGYAMMIL